MSTFALRELTIYKESGSKLKVLKPQTFIFSNPKYDNFFYEGVVIQAIVGKNGSGKSSLLDMLFRMLNNLAALMFRCYKRPASERMYFIKDVVADLKYTLDGKDGLLQCTKNSVKLTIDEESFEWSLESSECVHKISGKIVQEKTGFPIDVKAASYFFYTIATNYSVQAYITNDYLSDQLFDWDETKKDWVKTNGVTSWIDRVFHKNDGYMSPIVLNPYRNEGTIDMVKEEGLTTNRLCAILWETRSLADEEEMIEGYRLCYIEYKYDNSTLINKFDEKHLKKLPEVPFPSKFNYCCRQDNSIAKSILDTYGVSVDEKMSLVETSLRIYLAYKTLRIAEKYPSYSHFKQIGDHNLVFQSLVEKSYHDLVKNLVQQIQNDNSHITLKIRQTLSLINLMSKPGNKELFENQFTYSDYIRILDLPEKVDTVEERNELLPPPIFKPMIYLIKNEDFNQLKVNYLYEVDKFTKECRKNAIKLNDLSSGERQFIYMASTLVYHTLNLKSIPETERIKYNHILMVLDEIEICFHPEYQRTFVSKLLALFKRMNMTSINVLIVTHSPFILSDITQGNIMYLEDGHQLTKDEIDGRGMRNPFCANINDILHQSFFLDKGFVGEFAKQKVISLADYLSENKNEGDWDEVKAKAFIDEVSEPLVRERLFNMYIKRFGVDIQRKIALYQAEIERLQQEER